MQRNSPFNFTIAKVHMQFAQCHDIRKLGRDSWKLEAVLGQGFFLLARDFVGSNTSKLSNKRIPRGSIFVTYTTLCLAIKSSFHAG